MGRKGLAGEVTLTSGGFWPLDVTYFVKLKGDTDLKFVWYLLKRANLPSLAKAVKPGINRNEVYRIPIKIPSRATQERIVSILDKAYERIAIAEEHVEAGIKQSKALLSSELSNLVRSQNQTWTDAALGSVTKFIDYRGRTPKKTTAGLPLITAKNVRMGYLKDEPREFVAADTYTRWMTRGIPKPGDILFTTEAPLANVAQLETAERVVFAQRIIVLQPDPKRLDPTFLKFLLISPPIQKQIHKKSTGATATGIKASLLKTIKIPFPLSIKEQVVISGRLTQLHRESEELACIYAQKLESLRALKSSMLHHALSGTFKTCGMRPRPEPS